MKTKQSIYLNLQEFIDGIVINFLIYFMQIKS